MPCTDCLDLFELWSAEGIDQLLQTALNGEGDLIPITQRPTAGVIDGKSAIVSLNFFASLFERGDSTSRFLTKPSAPANLANTVVVGVLDSGVDTSMIPDGYLWKASNKSKCADIESIGWNFTDRNANVFDGTRSKHGTLVNAFILDQFFKEKTNNTIKLMNVKVLDDCNSGTLFDFVCGALYSKQHGAHIINSSMGFYDNEDYGTEWEGKNPILQILMRDHLLPAGIIVVSAAGNIGGHEYNFPGNPRDLTINKFYPAVMSNATGKMPNNVITATSVDVTASAVSPRQNYSPLHVDVGVVANVVEGDVFRFFVPFSEGVGEGRPWVTGSSFAAPVITGKIAARFDPSLINSVKTEPKYYWLNGVFGSQMYPNSENLVNRIDRGRYTRIE